MKKIHLTWQDVQAQVQEILRQLAHDKWQPDYIVGLTRGGLVPANLLSQYLDVPMECLKVSLRDDSSSPEHNLWMAEDAAAGKQILIVDDINDTGATLNWIKEDWQASVASANWSAIWGHNVRVAVLYDNESSASLLEANYCTENINKAADPQWIVFPWEQWWKHNT